MLRYQNPRGWSYDVKTRGVIAEGLDVILATPERVLVSQHRPDAEDLISILASHIAKSYVVSLPGRVLVELYQDALHSERGQLIKSTLSMLSTGCQPQEVPA
jgi:hypothetical protein